MQGFQAAHLTCGFVIAPALHNLRPKERRKKKERRNFLTASDTLIGSLKRKLQEFLSIGLRDNNVKHRENGFVNTILAKLSHTRERMPTSEKLQNFVN